MGRDKAQRGCGCSRAALQAHTCARRRPRPRLPVSLCAQGTVCSPSPGGRGWVVAGIGSISVPTVSSAPNLLAGLHPLWASVSHL